MLNVCGPQRGRAFEPSVHGASWEPLLSLGLSNSDFIESQQTQESQPPGVAAGHEGRCTLEAGAKRRVRTVGHNVMRWLLSTNQVRTAGAAAHGLGHGAAIAASIALLLPTAGHAGAAPPATPFAIHRVLDCAATLCSETIAGAAEDTALKKGAQTGVTRGRRTPQRTLQVRMPQSVNISKS